MKATEEPPRWDTSILHESFDSRSYRDAIELHAAGMTRLEALFDERLTRLDDDRRRGRGRRPQPHPARRAPSPRP
mgnify:CR=1 FL=1